MKKYKNVFLWAFIFFNLITAFLNPIWCFETNGHVNLEMRGSQNCAAPENGTSLNQLPEDHCVDLEVRPQLISARVEIYETAFTGSPSPQMNLFHNLRASQYACKQAAFVPAQTYLKTIILLI